MRVVEAATGSNLLLRASLSAAAATARSEATTAAASGEATAASASAGLLSATLARAYTQGQK